MYKIYLDTCCFNRPFDVLSQDKIRFECEAVLLILNNCDKGIWQVFRSDVLDDEIDRTANVIKKLKVEMLYSSATLRIELDDKIITKAKNFQKRTNIKPFDALHLACAECAGADVLLTTDIGFIRQSEKAGASVKVANPAKWLVEVMFDE